MMKRLTKALQEAVESRYFLQEPLSGGSFGLVFRGLEREQNIPVAIKIFNAQAERFQNSLNELRLLFRLRHPHVVKILDLFYIQNSYALVFEFMNQGDLRQKMESQGCFSEVEALMIVNQIAAGLAYIHSKKIVHHDLKPENILVHQTSSELIYKLADFNISKFNNAGELLASNQGSPLYMAPEQFYDRYDHRADLYSLGIIFFELLTGKTPFEGSLQELMRAHIQTEISWHKYLISEPLQDLLKNLLAKNPQERPSDSQTLLEKLEGLLRYQVSLVQQRADQRPFLDWDEKRTAFFLDYLDRSLHPLLFSEFTGVNQDILAYLQERNYLRLFQEENQSPSSS